MSWLDATIATPLIGVTIEPHYSKSVRFRDGLAPLLDELQTECGEVTIGGSDSTFSTEVETPKGFSYSIRPDNLLVRFRYRSSLEAKPGKFPQYKFEPHEVQPYTELLSRVAKETTRLLHALTREAGTLSVLRIGIVASSRIDAEHVPPGIARHVDHFRLPWNANLAKCQALLLVPLRKDENGEDRCHHHFEYAPLDKPGEMEVKLDWQRFPQKPYEAKSETEPRFLFEACEAASAYFERVGDGSLWQ